MIITVYPSLPAFPLSLSIKMVFNDLLLSQVVSLYGIVINSLTVILWICPGLIFGWYFLFKVLICGFTEEDSYCMKKTNNSNLIFVREWAHRDTIRDLRNQIELESTSSTRKSREITKLRQDLDQAKK